MNQKTKQSANTWEIIGAVLAVAVIVLSITKLASSELNNEKAYFLGVGIVSMGAAMANIACAAFRTSLNERSVFNWGLAALFFGFAVINFAFAAYS